MVGDVVWSISVNEVLEGEFMVEVCGLVKLLMGFGVDDLDVDVFLVMGFVDYDLCVMYYFVFLWV